MKTAFLLSAMAAFLLSGCPDVEEDETDWGDNTTSPHLANVDVPLWPPLGPNGIVTIHATDDNGLASVQFNFLFNPTVDISGTSATAEISGSNLGEGFGTLSIIAQDVSGNSAERQVDSLLVDLTPPTILVEKTAFRRAEGEELSFWVGDAWVLGHVEVTVGGQKQAHLFDAGIPSTLGEAWDYSLVSFKTTDFPEGSSTATIKVFDAAGNSIEENVDIVLDGTPPTTAILAPSSGATVSGLFEVTVSATDATDGWVIIELSVAGAPAGMILGPSGTVRIDSAEIPPGDVDLVAVARDEAGNESPPVTVPIHVVR